jgi:hypothetical protein
MATGYGYSAGQYLEGGFEYVVVAPAGGRIDRRTGRLPAS